MLLSIPPKFSLMIFDRSANLKYRYGNRRFWRRGYYIDTVGRKQKKVEDYIRKQLNEDKLSYELRRKELYMTRLRVKLL